MPNGSGIRDVGWLCQGNIIVPKPESNTQYYLFTMDFNSASGWIDVYYSLIDMSLQSGLGNVTTKNVLLRQSCGAGISATHHANGTDVWLVLQGGTNANYYAYRITPTGINTPVVSSVFTAHTQYYAKFSPSGNHYVTMIDEIVTYAWSKTAILNFNKETGIFTSDFDITDVNYAFSFSPDGSKLYFCGSEGLEQYDIATHVKTDLIGSNFTTMQLASDGRIYMAGAVATKLWVIQNPNLSGAACGVQQLNVQFNQFFYHFPTFIESNPQNILPEILFTNACQLEPINFSITNASNIQSVLWNFGDGNTSTELTPVHAYANAGEFTVTLSITYISGNTQNITKQIIISELPVKLTIQFD